MRCSSTDLRTMALFTDQPSCVALVRTGEVLSGDIDILLGSLATAEAKKHAGRRPSAVSLATSESSTTSAAPSGRVVLPPTVVEVRESQSDSDDRKQDSALPSPFSVPAHRPPAAPQAPTRSPLDRQQSAAERTHQSGRMGDNVDLVATPNARHIQLPPPDESVISSTMPPDSYAVTFDPQKSPLPPFGSLRASLIPIVVFSVEVEKKVVVSDSASLNVFGVSKTRAGDWKRRTLVLTSWNAVTSGGTTTETDTARRISFSCLHVFKEDSPSSKEVGRMLLNASTVVGWLDSSSSTGHDADGRKYVLSVVPRRKDGQSVSKDIFGEVGERLLVSMPDE